MTPSRWRPRSTRRARWWCNDGPGAPACDTTSGPVDADPWLFLVLDATPDSVLINRSSTLIADLTENSDGVDTSGLGTLPDGVPVTFAASPGSVAPAEVGTVSGVAESVYAAGSTAGPVTATATVDHQTVEATIEVATGIPTLDLAALAALAVALAAAALLVLGRLS